jgi:hypothetical protein
MTPDLEDRPVPNEPQIKADTWFGMAIAGFVVAIVAFVSAGLWVFSTGDELKMVQKAQAFTPFGAALVAIVTFFTIAWRGVLNTTQLAYQAQQLAHQADQLAQTKRQNDSKDEENLAKLLMDGAKLLGDEKESHVLAGVAALQAVVTSTRATFAPHAMDILADLIQATHADYEKRKVFNAAKQALNNGAARGQRAQRSLSIDFSGLKIPNGVAINGVSFIHYVDATFYDDQFQLFADISAVHFKGCLFEECTLPAEMTVSRDCTFDNCKITKFTTSMVKNNTFDDCDFSGAIYSGSSPSGSRLKEINQRHPLYKLISGGNYFRLGEPVRSRHSIDWSLFLDCFRGLDIEDSDEEDTEAALDDT